MDLEIKYNKYNKINIYKNLNKDIYNQKINKLRIIFKQSI